MVVDRPSWWKSFFQDMVDLGIFDPSEPAWTVSGFVLLVFCEKNIQALQMNGIQICFCQTETLPHLADLTLYTFYPIFM